LDGGQNAFYIDDLGPDATGSADANVLSSPFVIEAGVPTYTLYLDESGRVGMGTSVPHVELHVTDGDSPTIRLDQTDSYGWAPQVWDLTGNETNFYIRDITNGGSLPFRVQPGSPTNSLIIRESGNVGLGTWSPSAPLELETTGENAAFIAQRTDGATAVTSAMTDTTYFGSQSAHPLNLVVNDEPILTLAASGQMTVGLGATVTLILDPSGNLVIAGALTEASDAALKERFEPIDAQNVLARILQLPITTWNYIADGASVRHMGPMAQDFYAAFGLGVDDAHIAPLDVNGVTLVALQELARLFQAQETQIEKLERENQELEQRLEAIEAQLDALLAAQE
ncbi:MAG: tail fiber domain-containing protein, partial [Anaerolineae bacterium]